MTNDKKMKTKNITIKSRAALLFAGLVIMMSGVKAQNNQFSYTQYMDNLTPLNPAYSLLDKAGSVNTLVRKQWAGIDGAPTTFLFNGNMPIEQFNASAGLVVLNDQFAIENQTEVNAYFAKSVQVGTNHYLGVSLNAGLRGYTANYSQLDAADPVFANDVRQTKPNVGFGIIYYSDKYYIGVSVPELTINSLGTAGIQNSSNFANHYYFSGAVLLNIDQDITFKPATLLSYAKGVPFIGDISGTFYMKNEFGIGLNYRTNSELATIVTYNVNSFHIGYSYQFGTSSDNLGGFSNATHEITLGYRFGNGAANSRTL